MPDDPAELLAAAQASVDAEDRSSASERVVVLLDAILPTTSAEQNTGAEPSRELLKAAAELCEQIGLVAAAIRVREALLTRDPSDADGWTALADLHEERGDLPAAARCRSRGRPPSPATNVDGPVSGTPRAKGSEAGAAEGIPPWTAADVDRFLALFTGREDLHARQWFDRRAGRSGYSPVDQPLEPSAVGAHLAGEQTLGSYVLRADSSGRWCVLDLDLGKEAIRSAAGKPELVADLATRLQRETRRLVGHLQHLGLPFLLEDSGHKGRHAWIFLERPVEGAALLDFGRSLLRAHPIEDPKLHLEFFPKQALLSGKGLGNLVKLPLGVHQVSGRRALLLKDDGSIDPAPWERLRAIVRVPASALDAVRERLEREHEEQDLPRPGGSGCESKAPKGGVSRKAGTKKQRKASPRQQPWTEDDFGQDADFAPVLAGCGVLKRLVERAIAGDELIYDELIALKHTLGHLPTGPRGVNFLLSKIPGLDAALRLKRPLRGSPASCENLRRRVPGLSRRLGCGCDFGPRLPSYPTPLLHLGREDRVARIVPLEGERTRAEPRPAAGGRLIPFPSRRSTAKED